MCYPSRNAVADIFLQINEQKSCTLIFKYVTESVFRQISDYDVCIARCEDFVPACDAAHLAFDHHWLL